jgi:hypothetical protein
MPNVDPAAKTWQKDLAGRIGHAVQVRRQELKMTAAALDKRTAELGYPVSRVAIGKIENNHRAGKLDLAELLVIAAALDIAPLELLYPGAPDQQDQLVQILPGRPTPTLDARDRFIGDRGLATLSAQLERLNLAITLSSHGDLRASAVPVIPGEEATQ